MSCAACSARVEKAVSSLSGVTSCSVNLLTNSMTVEGSVSDEVIIDAVKRAGYGISGYERKAQTTDEHKLKKILIVSALLTVILMYFSMGHMVGLPHHSFGGVAQLILSAAVLILNKRFFISGAKGVINRSPNMDTLVAMGSGISFIYSVYLLLQGEAHGLYFESAAMILTLITVGKLLEARSKGKTADAINGLMSLAPQTATVIRDGNEVTVSVEELVLGDIFVIRPGESVPTDAVVVSGNGSVDESALTGESIPADKKEGDRVFAGTVNRFGFLKCSVTGLGEDTLLSRIIQTVTDAAAEKAPAQKLADKVSGVFVPMVIALAVITTLSHLLLGQAFGYALSRGIAVLVISCPCALGLATPVAVMVGSGVAAKRGILFKTAASLEYTGKVKTVALDKTGTVTLGQPTVTDIIKNDDMLEAAAYSLEAMSEHPLARAVVKRCEGVQTLDITDFEALSGNGVTAMWQGKRLYGGSLKFMSQNVEISAKTEAEANALAKQGKTPILFSAGDKYLGMFGIADTLKPDSREAIEKIKRLGIKVVMLTGDNEATAAAIGQEAGVSEIRASLLPQDKERVIKELDGPVMMVGDGINDAPALTRADIGVAIGAGTDIAIDAADVVLMNSSLTDVEAAIRLSRRVLKIIKENLFWAFVYNLIGIPLAAGAFGLTLDPMFAAGAMSLSSFCVVTNALRINLFDRKKEKKIMEKTLKIEGMMCPHCEARVRDTLLALDGVMDADVSHEKGTAVVTLSKDVADDVLVGAVTAQGYKVK